MWDSVNEFTEIVPGTMHLNNSSSIDLYAKVYSVPKSKCRKVLSENTFIIGHEINKLRLQIREALHIKKKPKKNLEIIELTLKIATMFWNTLDVF